MLAGLASSDGAGPRRDGVRFVVEGAEDLLPEVWGCKV